MLNAGGDVYTIGKNSKGLDWSIGVKHPRNLDDLLVKFRFSGMSIATSGDYERFKIVDGKRYHHILYPKTGLPGNKCQSVTVISENSEEGTVIAKYIFLLGYKEFSKSDYAKTLKYIYVMPDGTIKYSQLLIENDIEFIDR